MGSDFHVQGDREADGTGTSDGWSQVSPGFESRGCDEPSAKIHLRRIIQSPSKMIATVANRALTRISPMTMSCGSPMPKGDESFMPSDSARPPEDMPKPLDGKPTTESSLGGKPTAEPSGSMKLLLGHTTHLAQRCSCPACLASSE